MDAIVLAAGMGSRLRPLSEHMPKAAFPVANRPLGSFCLSHLIKAGVTRAVVNTFHLGDRVADALTRAAPADFVLAFSNETTLLGTGGGLKRAKTFIDGHSDQIIVMNTDLIFSPDIAAAVAFHQSHGALATMVVRNVADPDAFGRIDVDGSGRVVGLLGEPDVPSRSTQGYMFSGTHVLADAAFADLPEEGCVIRTAYRYWVDAGAPVYAIVDDSPWWDLGTLAAYHAVNVGLADGTITWPGVEPRGGVIDDGADISPDAHVSASVIGAGVRVNDGASVERCVVWPDTVVTGAHHDSILTPEHTIKVELDPA